MAALLIRDVSEALILALEERDAANGSQPLHQLDLVEHVLLEPMLVVPRYPRAEQLQLVEDPEFLVWFLHGRHGQK